MIFSMFTGILIAWSFQSGGELLNNLVTANRAQQTTNVFELVQFSIITVVTISMFILLFLATGYASFHVFGIIIAEIWYSMFLFYLTSNHFELMTSSTNPTAHP